MLIDWFTVGAQALNFIVLVWLLKRFLYRPILAAIDGREQRIAKERADADAIRTEAGHERDALRQKNADFDTERAGLRAKASADAAAEHQRLVTEARAAADSLAARRRDAVAAEARALQDSLTRRVTDEVLAIARQALHDLADADLDAQVTTVFVARLRGIDGQPRADLAAALAGAAEPALVRSAFELPAAARAAVAAALDQIAASPTPPRFETAPNLIGGIELSVAGQKLSWNVADYLATLNKTIAAMLTPEDPVPAEAAPKPTADPT